MQNFFRSGRKKVRFVLNRPSLWRRGGGHDGPWPFSWRVKLIRCPDASGQAPGLVKGQWGRQRQRCATVTLSCRMDGGLPIQKQLARMTHMPDD